MTTRVYRYGLLAPVENGDLVLEQIRLAHRYRNTLVEVERERRNRIREALASYPNVEVIATEHATRKLELEQAIGAVKGRRRADRRRSETDIDRARIKAARDRLKEVRDRLRAVRKEVTADQAVQTIITDANEHAAERRRSARAACGVYWGTYLIIEQADEASRKMPLYDFRGEPRDPRFQRFTGQGVVAVQVQKGMAIEQLHEGADSRLRVVLGEEGHRRRRADVYLRVGSEGRAPIFARFPAVWHRSLPYGARVTWAKVTRRKLGLKWRWELHVTVELLVGWTAGHHGEGVVAIDLGWRLRDTGAIRVGFLRDESGRSEEIPLGAFAPSGLDKADSLRSIRDERLNGMRPELVSRLDAVNAVRPDWILEWTRTLSQWRSAERFHNLASFWKKNRFDGDEPAFDLLEVWRQKDEHLYTWEVNQRRKTLARRKDGYSVLAAELARRYQTLVIEGGLDLRVFQRHHAPEGDPEIAAQRLQQCRSSVSELRNCLVSAFLARGGDVVRVPCQDTTRTCHVCGSIEEWDQKILIHTCDGCGATWDQDENAAVNLLAWRERDDAEREIGGARAKGPGRFARLKAKKAEREEGGEAGARGEEGSYAVSGED